MAAAIQRVVTRRTGVKPRISAFPWWLVSLASPLVTTFREMLEMRYVWREPVQLDNTRLIAELGREPHTPLDEAIEATLLGLGCMTP
jgi:nucleoside-diphosphate-sugar epimerase